MKKANIINLQLKPQTLRIKQSIGPRKSSTSSTLKPEHLSQINYLQIIQNYQQKELFLKEECHQYQRLLQEKNQKIMYFEERERNLKRYLQYEKLKISNDQMKLNNSVVHPQKQKEVISSNQQQEKKHLERIKSEASYQAEEKESNYCQILKPINQKQNQKKQLQIINYSKHHNEKICFLKVNGNKIEGKQNLSHNCQTFSTFFKKNYQFKSRTAENFGKREKIKIEKSNTKELEGIFENDSIILEESEKKNKIKSLKRQIDSLKKKKDRELDAFNENNKKIEICMEDIEKKVQEKIEEVKRLERKGNEKCKTIPVV